MTDGTAEGGVISKEIEYFPRVGEIIDENQKKKSPERCLEELQPGQEEGLRELYLGSHVDCDRRGSLRAMSGDGLGYHGKRVVSRAGCQTVSKARDMSRDMALISCLA